MPDSRLSVGGIVIWLESVDSVEAMASIWYVHFISGPESENEPVPFTRP